MDEKEAYDLIQKHLTKIENKLKEIGYDAKELDLTHVPTICALLNEDQNNSNNAVYVYLRKNWNTLQTVGCVQKTTYRLSFRGVVRLLSFFEFFREEVANNNEKLWSNLKYGFNPDLLAQEKITELHKIRTLLLKDIQKIEDTLDVLGNYFQAFDVAESIINNYKKD